MTTKTNPPKFSEHHKYVIRDVETKELDSSCNTFGEALTLLANAEYVAQLNGFESSMLLFEIVTMKEYKDDEIKLYGVAQSEDEVEKMTTRTPPMCGECFGDPRLEK